jgi:hypothetical protein
MITRLLLLAALAVPAFAAEAPPRKILFFTKSSGYEHEVISYKKGMPSFAEKQLLELGKAQNWTFTSPRMALSSRRSTSPSLIP